MKRKEHLADWRKKTIVALRAELKELRYKEDSKAARSRILTIIREKELTNE